MPGKRLSLAERQVIERMFRAKYRPVVIAVALGRARSTIEREIARNGGARFHQAPSRRPPGSPGKKRGYNAVMAQYRARRRAKRPKARKLVGALAVEVGALLRADLSPQQVAAVLRRRSAGEKARWVSHETIYRCLFVQTRGELRKELTTYLRTQRTKRKPRTGVKRRGLIGIVPISERPAEATDRAVPGHWEGDLLCGGTGKGAVITLVERKTRFLILAPLPTTRAGIDLHAAMVPLIKRLPEALRRSLTWDRGTEMGRHLDIAIDAGIDIYFADPHSPWQRGSNENTNGLLRQYWPKGCDMRGLTQADCDAVALRLNTRPRMTLNWRTPAEAFTEACATTP